MKKSKFNNHMKIFSCYILLFMIMLSHFAVIGQNQTPTEENDNNIKEYNNKNPIARRFIKVNKTSI